MSLFSDLPRIWSRQEVDVANAYIQEWADGGPYVTFRNPTLTLDLDSGSFAARLESRDIYVREALTQNLRLTTPVYGEVDGGNAGVISGSLPGLGFSRTSSSSPVYATFTEWAGVYSEDKSFSQAFTWARGTSQPLYTQQNSVLGASPSSNMVNTGLLVNGAVKCIAFSPTNVWIFYAAPTVSPSRINEIYLAVWNGTTVTSNTRLDVGFVVGSFQIIRGTAGQVYLMYTEYFEAAGTGLGYIRSVNESTGVMSAVLWSGLVESPTGYASNRDAINCNKVYTISGVNYLVNLWQSVMTVHTYATATPNTLTLLCQGTFAQLAPYPAKSAGVEYDPVSNEAHLVIWSITDYLINGGPFTNQLKFTRQSHKITLGVFTPQTVDAQELLDFVGVNSDFLELLRDGQVNCYIPSNTGAARESFLYFYCTLREGSSALLQGYYIRFKNWNDPGPIDGTLDIDTDETMVPAIRGNVDYVVPIDLSPTTDIKIAGVRPRVYQINTRWALQANSNVDAEVLVTPELLVSIDGATGDLEDSQVEILPSLDVVISAETIRLVDAQVDIPLELVVVIDAESSPPVTEVYLNNSWLTTGTTWMNEFMQFVNDERAALFELPPLKIMGSDALSLKFLQVEDIAARHSKQMAFFRLFDHSNGGFEPGWQVDTQRINYLTNQGAENIQILINSGYGHGGTPWPTPEQAWLGWKDSPGHYANMMRNWGANAEFAYSNMGSSFGPYPTNVDFGGFPIDETFETVYLTNNLLILKETPMETSVTQFWKYEGLDGLFLPQYWNASYYQQIKTETEHPYSLHLSTEIDHPLSSILSVEVEHPWTVQVQSEVEHPWGMGSTPVRAEINHLYDLQRLPVASEIEHAYSIKLSTETDYPVPEVVKLRAEIEHPLSALQSIALEQTHSVPLGAKVRAEFTWPYDIQLRPLVSAEHTWLYALEAGASAASSLEVYLNARGSNIRVQDGLISADVSGSGFKFECRLESLAGLENIIGDFVAVDFCGTAYSMVVTGVSASAPEGSVAPAYTLTAFSPVVLLDSPYAAQISYSPTATGLFSQAISDILGIPVAWEVVDWLVEPQRIQVSNSTPLSAARSLLESVGAILISLPNGQVKAVYRYEYSLGDLSAVPVAASLVDDNQVFSVNTRYEFNLGLNRFRIKDSDSAFGDQIEWEVDATNPKTGIASVYLSPERSTWDLMTTADTGVVVEFLGEVIDTITEVVEFRSGQAQTRRPIITLDSLSWLSTPLGGVSFAPSSKNLSALTTVNSGYGLIEITYTYRRYDFRVSADTPIIATQLVVQES